MAFIGTDTHSDKDTYHLQRDTACAVLTTLTVMFGCEPMDFPLIQFPHFPSKPLETHPEKNLIILRFSSFPGSCVVIVAFP